MDLGDKQYMERLTGLIFISCFFLLPLAIVTKLNKHDIRKKYNKLKQDFDKLFGYNASLQERYKDVLDRYNEVSRDDAATNEKYNNLYKEHLDLQQKHKALNSEHNTLKENHSLLESKYTELSANIADLNSKYNKISNSNNEIYRLKKENLELTKESQELKSRINKESGEHWSLKLKLKELEEKDRETQNLKTLLEEKDKENQLLKLTILLSKHRDNKENANNYKTNTSQALIDSSKKIKILEDKVEELNSLLDDTKRQLEITQSYERSHSRDINKKDKEISELWDKTYMLGISLREKEELVSKLQRQLSKLESDLVKEINTKDNDVEIYKKKCEQLESELRAAKVDREIKNNKKKNIDTKTEQQLMQADPPELKKFKAFK